MKTQSLWTLVLLSTLFFPLLLQAQNRPTSATFGVGLYPYLYRTVLSTDNFKTLTEVRAGLQPGISGERFLRDRFSVRASLLYRALKEEYITASGNVFLPVSYRTIQSASQLLHGSIGARWYAREQRRTLQTYLGGGIDSQFQLYGTAQKPYHPDPEVANLIEKESFQFHGVYGSLEGGMRYRILQNLSAEFGMFSRLPFTKNILQNAQMGLSIGVLYVLTE